MIDKNLYKWMNLRLEEVKHTKPNEISANCPFCESIKGSPDHKQHFSANPYKETFHCFRCGKSGTLINLIMAVDGVSYTQAIFTLSGKPVLEDYQAYKESLITKPNIQQYIQKHDVSELGNIHPLEDDSYVGKLVLNYLRNRHISEYLINSGIFGYINGILRVYILSADTYWQGRAITSLLEPKYHNPKFPITGTLGLYDSSLLKEYFNNDKPLYVCEGVFSSLAMLMRGYAACCLYGKEIRKEQFQRLVNIDRDLVVMLDADAKEQAWNIALQLYNVRGNTQIALLPYGDPEDCKEFEIIEATDSNFMRWKVENYASIK